MTIPKHKYEVGQLLYFRVNGSIFRSKATLIRWGGEQWNYIGDGLPDWISEEDVSESFSRIGGRDQPRPR